MPPFFQATRFCAWSGRPHPDGRSAWTIWRAELWQLRLPREGKSGSSKIDWGGIIGGRLCRVFRFAGCSEQQFDNRNNNGFRLARSSGTVVDASRASQTDSAPASARVLNMRSKTQQSSARASRPGGFRLERPSGGLFSGFRRWFCMLMTCAFSLPAYAHAILAGGEFDLPEDRPSFRLDPLRAGSAFNFVGALEMFSGGSSYRGSAAALSPNWVLTAGHNVDFNDDGVPDDELTVNFHLPGFSINTSTSELTYPSFTGFGNPSIHHDLALLYFENPLPNGLAYPALGVSAGINDVVTLVGFGRSGFGSYGYTTNASLTDRRVGFNTIVDFESQNGGDGLLFRYNFDAPDSTASLGNDLETLIGPGDSGGPALFSYDDRFALLGINTFTDGYGGRFGDIGGGVALDPYWEWISDTTGLALVPEPAAISGILGGMVFCGVLLLRRRKGDRRSWVRKKSGR